MGLASATAVLAVGVHAVPASALPAPTPWFETTTPCATVTVVGTAWGPGAGIHIDRGAADGCAAAGSPADVSVGPAADDPTVGLPWIPEDPLPPLRLRPLGRLPFTP